MNRRDIYSRLVAAIPLFALPGLVDAQASRPPDLTTAQKAAVVEAVVWMRFNELDSLRLSGCSMRELFGVDFYRHLTPRTYERLHANAPHACDLPLPLEYFTIDSIIPAGDSVWSVVGGRHSVSSRRGETFQVRQFDGGGWIALAVEVEASSHWRPFSRGGPDSLMLPPRPTVDPWLGVARGDSVRAEALAIYKEVARSVPDRFGSAASLATPDSALRCDARVTPCPKVDRDTDRAVAAAFGMAVTGGFPTWKTMEIAVGAIRRDSRSDTVRVPLFLRMGDDVSLVWFILTRQAGQSGGRWRVARIEDGK